MLWFFSNITGVVFPNKLFTAELSIGLRFNVAHCSVKILHI